MKHWLLPLVGFEGCPRHASKRDPNLRETEAILFRVYPKNNLPLKLMYFCTPPLIAAVPVLRTAQAGEDFI